MTEKLSIMGEITLLLIVGQGFKTWTIGLLSHDSILTVVGAESNDKSGSRII